MRLQLLLIAIIALAGCDRPPRVMVDGELLSGKYVNGNVATFLGVPFAEPPVGNLRWRAPHPLTRGAGRTAKILAQIACSAAAKILEFLVDEIDFGLDALDRGFIQNVAVRGFSH